jgi:lipopolysaccharide transport system ATP-binding protein
MSDMDHYRLQALDGHRYAYEIRFERLALLPGRYHARSHAMDPEGLRLFDHVEMAFDVLGEARELGFVRLEHQWQDGPVP